MNLAVERAIKKYSVVVFCRSSTSRVSNHIVSLFCDDDVSPHRGCDVRVYHLDDLPAGNDIDSYLARLTETMLRIRQQEANEEEEQKKKKRHRPHRGREDTRQQEDHDDDDDDAAATAVPVPVAMERPTTSNQPPCYVFVHGHYLTIREVRDYFIRVAPKSKSVTSFNETYFPCEKQRHGPNRHRQQQRHQHHHYSPPSGTDHPQRHRLQDRSNWNSNSNSNSPTTTSTATRTTAAAVKTITPKPSLPHPHHHHKKPVAATTVTATRTVAGTNGGPTTNKQVRNDGAAILYLQERETTTRRGRGKQ
jgi:hypothetical protein